MDFSKLRHILFFSLLTGVSVVFLYIISPFAYPIFWAAIIAGIFYPLYTRLKNRLKSPNLSASITLVTALLVIILPLAVIATLIVNQSIGLYDSFDKNRDQIGASVRQIGDWIKTNPYTTKLNIDEQFWVEKFSEITNTIANYLFTSIKDLTQNSLSFMLQIVIMFYALFFFIRDGAKMLTFLKYLCPLGDRHEELLYAKFTSTARATLKGTIIVGAIQGILGGMLFLATGVQGAFIWGVVMAALSVIPPLSSIIVWLPAGLVMILTGNYVSGIIILAFGAMVISTIDNFLKPILVGKDAQMHPLLILFSTLGGILIFGLSGFIIGPILTSLFLAFWEIYAHYYKKELTNNNEVKL